MSRILWRWPRAQNSGGWPNPSPGNSRFGVAPPFLRFSREGGDSARTTICTKARKQTHRETALHTSQPGQARVVPKPEDWKWSSFPHHATGVQGTVEIESRWKRGGGGEWASCSWVEPTLPQRARERWGNRVWNLDSERMGQPRGRGMISTVTDVIVLVRQEAVSNTGMRSTAALVFLIALSFSLHAWAKCPTLTAEVHGSVQCSFKSDHKVLLTLIFKKNQLEASAEETALDLQGSSFRGRIGFETFTSYNPLTGHQCNRRPIVVLVRLVTAEGTEWDRKLLKFPNDFSYNENIGEYTLKSPLALKGWCRELSR